jgi:hypothetical protein
MKWESDSVHIESMNIWARFNYAGDIEVQKESFE